MDTLLAIVAILAALYGFGCLGDLVSSRGDDDWAWSGLSGSVGIGLLYFYAPGWLEVLVIVFAVAFFVACLVSGVRDLLR